MRRSPDEPTLAEAATSEIRVPWLLLIFTLPARQSSERVEVWRKLKKYGALALPTSGYLLPNTPENQERFEWIAAAIRKYKGQASVAQLQTLDDLPGRQAETDVH